jgi:3-phosphoshikimate 1-carboxyvinyltransferase
MSDRISLRKNIKSFNETIALVSSKSESNRALIINALMNFEANLSNISAARDSQTMQRLLKENSETADVLDAGTTMRFLTAYFSITGQSKIMTGTARMCERPIGLLTDALTQLGASITFLKNTGYPPFKINSFQYSGNNTLSISGDVSSQYISALLMIAPFLRNGLTINLLGNIGSIPYVEMTIAQMKYFGAKVHTDWDDKKIIVESGKYTANDYQIESDWSGASYWFAMVALGAENSTIKLLGLKDESLQGDAIIVEIMKKLGVNAQFEGDGYLLSKTNAESTFEFDFTNCPDLAQTVAVVCAAKGIVGKFTGLESLKIKETDRIFALQTELAKIDSTLLEVLPNTYRLTPSSKINSFTQISVHTYDDHRMAMAFAPLANLMDVHIDDKSVVNKSYPSFWTDMAKVFEMA